MIVRFIIGLPVEPYYYYKDGEVVRNMMEAVVTSVEKFFRDYFDMQNELVNMELLTYRNFEGRFGAKRAMVG